MICIDEEQLRLVLGALDSENCIRVWRSVGSFLFWEFGVPQIIIHNPKSRPPFAVVRGQVTLGLHSSNWAIYDNGLEILNSNEVDDHHMVGLPRKYFSGVSFPIIEISPNKEALLHFETCTVKVLPDDDLYDDDGELEIYLPGECIIKINLKKNRYSVSN